MSKHFLVFCLPVILFSAHALANQSAKDIRAILTDSEFQRVVADSEILSIINDGGRRYNVVHGACSTQVEVRSNCAPIPGGPCAEQVVFDSSSTTCLPTGPVR